MRSLASTQKNDLVINPDGRLSVVSGVPAVEVVARSHMQTRRGGNDHAIQDGIPFDPVAWAGTPNIPQFEAAARQAIACHSPVCVKSCLLMRAMDGDTLHYTTTLLTDFGEVRFKWLITISCLTGGVIVPDTATLRAQG